MCLVHQTKEEMVGTVEAVQALQVQSAHLQKSKEVYHAKCLELDRLRKEGAPLKELEKVGNGALGLLLRPPASRVLFFLFIGHSFSSPPSPGGVEV